MSDRGICLGCHTELLPLDDDPNGERNASCKRCRAEEDHDFDRFPGVTFSRSGEATYPPEKPAAIPFTLQAILDGAQVEGSVHGEPGARIAALESALSACWEILGREGQAKLHKVEAVRQIVAQADQYTEELVDDVVSDILHRQRKYGFKTSSATVRDAVQDSCNILNIELTPKGLRVAYERALEQSHD